MWFEIFLSSQERQGSSSCGTRQTSSGGITQFCCCIVHASSVAEPWFQVPHVDRSGSGHRDKSKLFQKNCLNKLLIN